MLFICIFIAYKKSHILYYVKKAGVVKVACYSKHSPHVCLPLPFLQVSWVVPVDSEPRSLFQDHNHIYSHTSQNKHLSFICGKWVRRSFLWQWKIVLCTRFLHKHPLKWFLIFSHFNKTELKCHREVFL